MDCGSTLSKTANGRPEGTRYLRCRLYADSGGGRRCTRHSIRLDTLTEKVSEQIRRYVQTYYTLGPLNIRIEQEDGREALERERAALSAQLERRSRALKALYLDKVSGLLTPEQFRELNRDFQEERRRLEGRLAKADEELAGEGRPGQEDLTECARGLLRLETVPRELVLALVEKIEVGEREPDTGRQEIRINWRF